MPSAVAIITVALAATMAMTSVATMAAGMAASMDGGGSIDVGQEQSRWWHQQLQPGLSTILVCSVR